MIDRYTHPTMRILWSAQAKLSLWCDVEIAAAHAMSAPDRVISGMRLAPTPSLEDVWAEETVTRHDVAAFLNVWRRGMDVETASWVHRGMTSSDLVDTANSLRLQYSTNHIDLELARLVQKLAAHALYHWNTPRLARTHGQPAEASTWGYWVANIVDGLARARDRLGITRAFTEVAKLSGPVGNYRYTYLSQERIFASYLRLNPTNIATQVVLRDRYADWVFALAQAATLVEAFALEVRLGQHFGIDELAEGFASGQVGSSAMPHKQNPIKSEQLCGLAKLVRAQVLPTLEGVALWHERDISHSSVERVTFSTAACLTHYMLVSLGELVDNLVVIESVMLANLHSANNVTESARLEYEMLRDGNDPAEVDALVRVAVSNPNIDITTEPDGDTGHILKWLRRLANTEISVMNHVDQV